ncbi:MAG TPA: MlaD family protein [Candidatus Hypogeohydataceae bacterium YC38]
MASSPSAKKVGIFFIVGMVILGVITFRAEHLGRFFKKHNVYKAYFHSSKGLKKGSKVSLSGVEVGEVKDIDVEGDRILVSMALERKVLVREGSTATIIPDFLFGKSYVDISLVSPTSPPLPPGSVMEGIDVPGFGDMLTKFDKAMASIETLASKRFIDRLIETMDSAHNLLSKLEKGEGTMGRLFTDETLFDELKGTVVNANDILGRMSRGEGTMGKLLADEELFHQLKETVSNANTLLGKMNRGEGTLGKLINSEDLYLDLKRMMLNLSETVNGFRAIMPQGAFSTVIYSSF